MSNTSPAIPADLFSSIYPKLYDRLVSSLYNTSKVCSSFSLNWNNPQPSTKMDIPKPRWTWCQHRRTHDSDSLDTHFHYHSRYRYTNLHANCRHSPVWIGWWTDDILGGKHTSLYLLGDADDIAMNRCVSWQWAPCSRCSSNGDWEGISTISQTCNELRLTNTTTWDKLSVLLHNSLCQFSIRGVSLLADDIWW